VLRLKRRGKKKTGSGREFCSKKISYIAIFAQQFCDIYMNKKLLILLLCMCSACCALDTQEHDDFAKLSIPKLYVKDIEIVFYYNLIPIADFNFKKLNSNIKKYTSIQELLSKNSSLYFYLFKLMLVKIIKIHVIENL